MTASSEMMTLYRDWCSAMHHGNHGIVDTPGKPADDERDAFVTGTLDPLAERLLAAPVTSATDLLAKTRVELNFVLQAGAGYGELAAEIERHLLPVIDDPLLALVTEYRAALDALRAAPDHDGTAEEEAFQKPYDRLCTAPPNATTLEGALAGVRLVHEEEATCGHQPDLTIKVLAAALAYFDGGCV